MNWSDEEPMHELTSCGAYIFIYNIYYTKKHMQGQCTNWLLWCLCIYTCMVGVYMVYIFIHVYIYIYMEYIFVHIYIYGIYFYIRSSRESGVCFCTRSSRESGVCFARREIGWEI